MNDGQNQTEAIQQLFNEHAASLYRYARYSLPSDIDPRDVVQEVFFRAYRAWDEFHGESSAKTWLFRIARNYIYDLLRKKRRERTYELTERNYGNSVSLDTIIELEDALSRLHPTYQQILNLRLLQDMSVNEVAEVLGWSESRVRVTFHRAKKKLRETLQDPPSETWENTSEGGETAHGTE